MTIETREQELTTIENSFQISTIPTSANQIQKIMIDIIFCFNIITDHDPHVHIPFYINSIKMKKCFEESLRWLYLCFLDSEASFTEEMIKEMESRLDEIVIYKIFKFPREPIVRREDTFVFENNHIASSLGGFPNDENNLEEYLRQHQHLCNKKKIEYHFYLNEKEIKLETIKNQKDARMVEKSKFKKDENEYNYNKENEEINESAEVKNDQIPSFFGENLL